MDWTNIVKQIFEIFIFPILGAAAVWIIRYINAKRLQLKQSADNAMAQKYIDLLSDTIIKCVSATNQTYVSELKKQNAFDLNAQQKAFDMTYQAVLSILTDDAISYLSTIYDDLENYVSKAIEAAVREEKLQ